MCACVGLFFVTANRATCPVKHVAVFHAWFHALVLYCVFEAVLSNSVFFLSSYLPISSGASYSWLSYAVAHRFPRRAFDTNVVSTVSYTGVGRF